MNRLRFIALLTAPSAALAQPLLPLSQVMSSTAPAPGAPPINTTPGVDVAPDGTVAVIDSQNFARNAYTARPGQPFVRTPMGFVATLPDGQRLGVNPRGAWATEGSAIIGQDGEIGLVGAIGDQTIDPYFWSLQALPQIGQNIRLARGRFDRVAVADTERTIVNAIIEGPGVTAFNRNVILESSSQGPRVIFRSGGDPLARPGVTFTAEGFGCDFATNRAGQIVFTAQHYRSGVLAGPAVLFHDGSALRIILDNDTNPPGFDPASRLQATSVALGINSVGDIAFFGRVSAANGNPPGVALFRSSGGVLAVAFRSGDLIPAAGPDVRGLIGDPLAMICPINDFGDVAFVVRLTGPGVSATNDGAVCMLRDGVVHIVAREGESIPGAALTPTPLIGEFSSFDSSLFMNGKRQTLLAISQASSPVRRAILSWSPSRGLQTLACDPMPLLYDGGVRTPTSLPGVTLEQRGNYWLRATGAEDGRRTLLSETGHAFFWATFPSSQGALYRAELLPECLADFNDDGFIDFTDYDRFAEAFEAAGPGADANNDGFIDFFDYGRFVEVFETGC